MRDTVGFATKSFQMDSLMQRIDRDYKKEHTNLRAEKHISNQTNCRVAICPHDDYTYAGSMYPLALENIRARVVIIFGVAHKITIRDKIIFENFTQWKSAYGNVKISSLRDDIIASLPKTSYIVSDSLQSREHSVEAMVPFLQYYNRNVEIIPILITNMSTDTMQAIAGLLAASIQKIASVKNLKWGEDFAFVISSDAVHYGDQDWGGKNYAAFGSDSSGFKKATEFEYKLIYDYLVPKTDTSKIKSFIPMLVTKNSEYKWTWCGRNSVPLGLFTALTFQKISHAPELDGILMGYSTSISQEPIRVKDILMGITAPANIHHWVGYAAIIYK